MPDKGFPVTVMALYIKYIFCPFYRLSHDPLPSAAAYYTTPLHPGTNSFVYYMLSCDSKVIYKF